MTAARVVNHVLVEQLRGEFKVFGEALGGLRQEMNDRFERVEHDLGEVKRDLSEVKRDVGAVQRELGEVETIVEHTVARIAQR